MDLVERAKMLFKQLEEDNPREASEVARRAFQIYGKLTNSSE